MLPHVTPIQKHIKPFLNIKIIFLIVSTKDTTINTDDLMQDREISSPTGITDTIRAAVPPVADIEDLCNQPSLSATRRANDFCSSAFGCSGPSRQQCNELIKAYKEQQQVDFNEFYINTQSLRHTMLLILLLCSMFVVSSYSTNVFHLKSVSFD